MEGREEEGEEEEEEVEEGEEDGEEEEEDGRSWKGRGLEGGKEWLQER